MKEKLNESIVSFNVEERNFDERIEEETRAANKKQQFHRTNVFTTIVVIIIIRMTVTMKNCGLRSHITKERWNGDFSYCSKECKCISL